MTGLVIIWFTIYLARTNIGVLLVDPRFLADMGLQGKSGMQGMLMTAYLVPYALANVFLSPLGDKFGPRKAMLTGVVIALTGTVAGGLAPAIMVLMATRVWMGVGQGIHYPNQSIFVQNWFSPAERGKANAFLAMGGCMAPVVAMPLFAWLVRSHGWESTFIVVGIMTAVASIPLVTGIITDSPHNNRQITDREKELIGLPMMTEPDAEIKQSESLAIILKNFDFWLITIGYLTYLAIWWGLLTWLPQYLMVARGVSLQSLGWISSLPYAIAVIAALCGGILSDRRGKRALVCFVALAGASLCIGAGTRVNSVYLCAFLIALGVGLDVMYYPSSWAILQSKLPSSIIGTGSGVMNGVSNLGSALTPFVMGVLIERTGVYESGMFFLAALGLVGAVSCLILIKRGM
jgi:Sugar phosphate permease